jgi:Protein of unknown function (DUF1553)/Protein of unknown function (DUF1549)/Planctomycete cytochrome C
MRRLRLLLPLLAVSLLAQAPDDAFFEAKIRPVLASKCYACHSSSLPSPMGGLALDTKAGFLKGGARGPVIVAGKPDQSRLLQAMRYADPHLQMPPTGKLPDAVLADFESWIAAGAPDPRSDDGTAAQARAPLKGMSIEEGRKWWAFQPVAETPAPAVKHSTWPATKTDFFVLAKLEEKGIEPSPAADPHTLVERVYVDLVGYKPSYSEVQAFVSDKSPDAYKNLVERLLASPHYGERWGRHWMDVARFGEDNPTTEATNPPYPFAWRYRDWIIEAINKDVPYDRFVKLQLAADLMPGTKREDLRALGYLGAAPVYHKDQRLSADVIYGFMTDDWDERIDAVSRGLLGMTVACARCHDHKFDPIPTKDYYALAGVFASTMRTERPLFDVEPKVEARYEWIVNRLFDLRYSADLLTNEASTVEGAEERVVKWRREIESLKKEMEALRPRYPKLVQHVERFWTPPPPRGDPPAAPASAAKDDGKAGKAAAQPQRRRRRNVVSSEPFMNVVYDAAQYVDGADANYTFINYRPGEARDMPVLPSANVTAPGDIVPRRFLTVLSKGDSTFRQGSGRAELGERIFSDGAPLAARVIVNRVWGWHFGKPLAGTPSDFGVQGEKPTHPMLLDDLAARFVAHGWSLKWLHREILLSAAYRQSSRPRADAAAADPLNALVWRMNPRRLDVESFRDSLLRAAGKLSDEMYGPSAEIDAPGNDRRTVYARVSRARLSNLLKQYDFPDPIQTASGRDLTTTSLQQLFLMNSAFLEELSDGLAASVSKEPDAAAKIRSLFRKVLSRDPSAEESQLAKSYLGEGSPGAGSVSRYAQILLSTNEMIFWP